MRFEPHLQAIAGNAEMRSVFEFFHRGGRFMFEDKEGKDWILRDDVTGYTIGPVSHNGKVQRYEQMQEALLGVLHLVGVFQE